MGDVVRLSSCSFRFSSPSSSSSSSPSSSSASFNTILQLGCLPIHQYLNKRVSAVADSAAPGTALASPRSLIRPISKLHRPTSFKVNAVVAESEPPKWWEKNAGPNMIDINSTQEFLSALGQAGDRLVIVEFYGTWCASCRALFPKLCRIAEEHLEILFLKVNFDENKPMCKSLNVKVLPYFHFYRGADGLVDAFSCSLAKVLTSDL